MLKIGVLALQGAFVEHMDMIKKLGVEALEIRKAEQLLDIDGLIIPGGESTTIGKLLKQYGMIEVIRKKGKEGFPLLGTCAGLILLSKKIQDGIPSQPLLELLDIETVRNAFGRQTESFEAEINLEPMGISAFKGVFIRAPLIMKTGDNVKTLAHYNGNIVAVQQGNITALAFHPELTGDPRIHQHFINTAARSIQ